MKSFIPVIKCLILPKSHQEDDSSRKEFILNILLVSLILFSAVASVVSAINFIILSAERSQNNSISLGSCFAYSRLFCFFYTFYPEKVFPVGVVYFYLLSFFIARIYGISLGS